MPPDVLRRVLWRERRNRSDMDFPLTRSSLFRPYPLANPCSAGENGPTTPLTPDHDPGLCIFGEGKLKGGFIKTSDLFLKVPRGEGLRTRLRDKSSGVGCLGGVSDTTGFVPRDPHPSSDPRSHPGRPAPDQGSPGPPPGKCRSRAPGNSHPRRRRRAVQTRRL